MSNKSKRNGKVTKMNQPQLPSGQPGAPNREDMLRGMQALAALGQRVKAQQVADGNDGAAQAFQPIIPPSVPPGVPTDAPMAAQGTEVAATLPKPTTQVVFDDRIEWTWEPMPDDFTVKAIYFKDGSPWQIQINMVRTNFELSSEQAKAIAEAMLSAVQWENVWRQHAGDFLANDCLIVKDKGEHE